MARRFYNLPPLTQLASFEAAARNQSFKDAAQELGVTPGAVSHQIKALEAETGATLFERRHRGVALTLAGESLNAALRSAFLDISRTLADIRTTADIDSVTITATAAVSALWLTPRIVEFWKEHPEIAVNQIISDRPQPGHDVADLRIYYGQPAPGSQKAPLFKDILRPVCAPASAVRIGACSLSTLAQQRLIHMDVPESSWTTWQHWFATLGYRGEIARGLRVNNYMIALQAAQEGAGVVLGWQRLVAPLLVNGSLVVLGDAAMPAPDAFYISESHRAQENPAAEALKAWLIGNA